MKLEKKVRLDKWIRANTNKKTNIIINDSSACIYDGLVENLEKTELELNKYRVVEEKSYHSYNRDCVIAEIKIEEYIKVFKKIKQLILLDIGSDNANKELNRFLANNEVIDIQWNGRDQVMITYIIEVEED